MKIMDFLVGNNSKSIDPNIESEIIYAARDAKISIKAVFESKDKKIIAAYYNYGDEAYDGRLKEKNEIFRKLNPIINKILTKHGYDIKQSLRSNYDKNIGAIFYFINDDVEEKT